MKKTDMKSPVIT